MIHSLRPSGRVIAVVAAIAVSGFVPVAFSAPAQADGPVWSQAKREKPVKHKKKKKKAAPVHITINTGGPGAPLMPGKTYTWPYTVTNSGTSPAPAVVFQSPLPAGMQFVSGTGNCVYQAGTTPTTPGQVICQLGTVNGGQVSTGAITAQVNNNAAPGAPVTSTATINWNGGTVTAPFPASQIAQTANLAVNTHAPTTINPGDTYEFTVNVTNSGPAMANNVTVNAPISVVGGKNKMVQITQADGSCVISGSQTSVNCGLGSMSPGATQTLNLQVQASQAVQPGAVVVNAAQASTSTYEPNLTNNHDSSRSKVRGLVYVKAANLKQLPATGSDSQTQLDLALGLLGVGLVLVRLGARRKV
ncbi:hypothetical protein GCM10027589_51690 [Actinocorallia lasiicapitis]